MLDGEENNCECISGYYLHKEECVKFKVIEEEKCKINI